MHRRLLHTLALLLSLSAAACGASPRDASARPPEAQGSGGATGEGPAGHGQVCSTFDGSFSRPCAEGLSCCYPCGTAGCDSVCHTPAECEQDAMRPSAPPAGE